VKLTSEESNGSIVPDALSIVTILFANSTPNAWGVWVIKLSSNPSSLLFDNILILN